MMVQDIYRNDKWRMLVACMMLNQSRGQEVKKAMRTFFAGFPDPQTVRRAGALKTHNMETILKPTGLAKRKVEMIRKFSEFWLEQGVPESAFDVANYPGCGDYAVESYRLFIDRDDTFAPKDKEVKRYLERAKQNRGSTIVDALSKAVDEEGIPFVTNGKTRLNEIWSGGHYWYDDRTFCTLMKTDDVIVSQRISSAIPEIVAAKRLLRTSPGGAHTVVRFGAFDNLIACHLQARDNTLVVTAFASTQEVSEVERDCETINRIACMACEEVPVDAYSVYVFVGNLYRRE